MPSSRPLTAPSADDARLLDDLLRNREVRILLERLPRLALPDWWLAGPALAQTVWNSLDDRPGQWRVRGYDIVYFDPYDLTYAGEDRRQRQVAELAADLGIEVVARNAARAHLRHEEELGVVAAPMASSREAIEVYATVTSCIGLTHDGRGDLRVHAPWGTEDLYTRRCRPNPAAARPAGQCPAATA